MKYIKMKYYLIIFVSLLLNGCNNNTNNNTVSDNKIEVNTKQKQVNNDQIIKDKQMIQNIMKYNTEKIKQNNPLKECNPFRECNPFKEYRNKLIEKSMNEPVMTQQMKEDYKKEYGYYPIQHRHYVFNKNNSMNDLHTTF